MILVPNGASKTHSSVSNNFGILTSIFPSELPVDGAAAPNDLAAFNNTPVVMQRISNDNGKSE